MYIYTILPPCFAECVHAYTQGYQIACDITVECDMTESYVYIMYVCNSNIYTYMHITHIYIHIWLYKCIYLYIYIRICMYIYIYIRIYMYIQGYQIAYGITVECENGHGFPLDEMLLMDFSTQHLTNDPELEGGEVLHKLCQPNYHELCQVNSTN